MIVELIFAHGWSESKSSVETRTGNIETRENRPDYLSRNVELRNQLDLFAYLLHCKSFPGVPTRHQDVDILIIRQNTEGEYAMLEHESVSGVVESLKVTCLAQKLDRPS